MPRAMMHCFIAALASISLQVADAKPAFVAVIPNGANVPGVEALGHVDSDGGGKRNAFGNDFERAGFLWTRQLCETDSDGDGQTNGQELGDPCCEWNHATFAKVRWTDGVSHPGDGADRSSAALWKTIDCAETNASSQVVDQPLANTTSGAGGLRGDLVLVGLGLGMATALW